MRHLRIRCLNTSQIGHRRARQHCLRSICPYQSSNSMHLHWAIQLEAWKAWREVSIRHKVKQKPVVLQKPNACAWILLHGERGSPLYGWVSSVATLAVPEELLLSSADVEPVVCILATCLTPLSVPFDKIGIWEIVLYIWIFHLSERNVLSIIVVLSIILLMQNSFCLFNRLIAFEWYSFKMAMKSYHLSIYKSSPQYNALLGSPGPSSGLCRHHNTGGAQTYMQAGQSYT